MGTGITTPSASLNTELTQLNESLDSGLKELDELRQRLSNVVTRLGVLSPREIKNGSDKPNDVEVRNELDTYGRALSTFTNIRNELDFLLGNLERMV